MNIMQAIGDAFQVLGVVEQLQGQPSQDTIKKVAVQLADDFLADAPQFGIKITKDPAKVEKIAGDFAVLLTDFFNLPGEQTAG